MKIYVINIYIFDGSIFHLQQLKQLSYNLKMIDINKIFEHFSDVTTSSEQMSTHRVNRKKSTDINTGTRSYLTYLAPT